MLAHLFLTITPRGKNYYYPRLIDGKTKASETKYNCLMSHHIQTQNVRLKSPYFFTRISPRKAH